MKLSQSLSVAALRASRPEMVRHVMEVAQVAESQARALLIRARWSVAKGLDKFARCEFDFTIAESDMVGPYAHRRQQAISFLMDA